ncbi:hypothetical protein ACX0G7_25940 [Flavitalea antarctica]
MHSSSFWLKAITTAIGVALVVLTFFEASFFESWLDSIPVSLSLGGVFYMATDEGLLSLGCQ